MLQNVDSLTWAWNQIYWFSILLRYMYIDCCDKNVECWSSIEPKQIWQATLWSASVWMELFAFHLCFWYAFVRIIYQANTQRNRGERGWFVMFISNLNNFFHIRCRIKVLVCAWLYRSFLAHGCGIRHIIVCNHGDLSRQIKKLNRRASPTPGLDRHIQGVCPSYVGRFVMF